MNEPTVPAETSRQLAESHAGVYDHDDEWMEEPCWCGAWTPTACTCP